MQLEQLEMGFKPSTKVEEALRNWLAEAFRLIQSDDPFEKQLGKMNFLNIIQTLDFFAEQDGRPKFSDKLIKEFDPEQNNFDGNPNNGNGWVYFAQNGDCAAVKIGYSKNPTS